MFVTRQVIHGNDGEADALGFGGGIGNAQEMAGGGAAAAELCVLGRELAGGNGDGGEAFVDGTAGADTLYNFLTEIAALGEVNAVHEARFLDEVFFENLDAEAGLAVFMTDEFPGGFVGLRDGA